MCVGRMENARNLILMELVDDNLNFELIAAAIGNLIEPVNVVKPKEVNPVRNEDYYESVIPNYNLDDFHNHFRMTRTTFQNLLNVLQQHGGIIDERVPFEKKLLFTIWMLSKPDSFLSSGDGFNLAKSTSHQIFCMVVKLIASLRHVFIVWPDEHERQRIIRTLQTKSGIPGVIGAIDGCHIAIKAPPKNLIDYYNRNSYHSIILQAVCNEKLQFTDVFVGTPGRVHDARVFKNSDLYTLITSDRSPLNENEHLLGDAAYPLLTCLLKPYRDNGHLNAIQTRFNKRMSSVRSMIEQAFGLLKCKFRRLKYLDMAKIDFVPSVVVAACVLHNFILTSEGTCENEINCIDMPDDNQDHDYFHGNAENMAILKRNYIASLLH